MWLYELWSLTLLSSPANIVSIGKQHQKYDNAIVSLANIYTPYHENSPNDKKMKVPFLGNVWSEYFLNFKISI